MPSGWIGQLAVRAPQRPLTVSVVVAGWVGTKPLTTHARHELDAAQVVAARGRGRVPGAQAADLRADARVAPPGGDLVAEELHAHVAQVAVTAARSCARARRPGTWTAASARSGTAENCGAVAVHAPHGLAGEEGGDTVAAQLVEVAARRRSGPTKGTSTNWAPGIRARPRGRRDRRAQVGVAVEHERRHVRQRPGGDRRRADAFGHATHSGMTSERSAMRASNGPEVCVRGIARAAATAGRRAPAARRRGSTGRRPPRRPSSANSAAESIVEASCWRSGSGQALRRAHAGAAAAALSSAERAAHRAGELGAQRRVEVAREQDVEDAVLVEASPCRRAAARRVDLPADRLAPEPAHEVEEVVADARR